MCFESDPTHEYPIGLDHALVISLHAGAVRHLKAKRPAIAKTLLETAMGLYDEHNLFPQDEEYIRLVNDLAAIEIEMGLFPAASGHLYPKYIDSATNAARRLFGEKHHITAMCYATLANLYACQNMPKLAQPEFERALEILDTDTCPEQHIRIEALENYAKFLHQTYRHEEARRLEARIHDLKRSTQPN
jgi:tetratricopeptide (TPR) repeat protein